MSAMNTEYTRLLNKDSTKNGETNGNNDNDFLLTSPAPAAASHSLELEYDLNDRWGATPRIRSNWLKPTASLGNIARALSIREIEIQANQSPPKSPNYFDTKQQQQKLYYMNEEDASVKKKPNLFGFQYDQWSLWNSMERTPGLLIAVILNLFLSTSFGLAMFPPEWNFPTQVPRAIGVQMFLFSTLIFQLVLTKMSQFNGPEGMMMVENILFLQVISRTAMKVQGQGIETFSTAFFTFALASIVVGIFFYCLGKFNLGNAVYFFPKHIIVGCIGGIGIFIFQTGMEVATNVPWKWSFDNLELYCTSKVVILWTLAVGFELLLRVLQNHSNIWPFSRRFISFLYRLFSMACCRYYVYPWKLLMRMVGSLNRAQQYKIHF